MKNTQLLRIILSSIFLLSFIEVNYAEDNTSKSNSPILAESMISTGETINLSSQNLDVRATRTKTENGWKLELVGKSNGKSVFSIKYPIKNASDYESSIKLVKLKKDSEFPEVIFDFFTGGAHCCTVSKILYSTHEGSWQIADLGLRDGIDIQFEDITGEGNFVIIGLEDSFYYTFDCYACSRPPIKIEEFRNGHLDDVTREPRFKKRLKSELLKIESDKNADWNSNGFLAGWVALKSLLGEQNDAFRRLLPLYDRTNQFGVMECVIPASIGKCPADKRKFIPFPEGLKKHLVSQKYLTSKEAARLPTGDAEVPQNESPLKDPTVIPPEISGVQK